MTALPSKSPRRAEYRRLARQLAALGWISDGYVQNRGPGAGGPCFQWTRKVKAKTVSVALSQEQFRWLSEAIANWKNLKKVLRQMQQLSRQELFESVPGPKRRKSLSKKALGVI